MSQSRSSVDFPATPLRLQLSCPHPPRLQHSPSLPNIWSVSSRCVSHKDSLFILLAVPGFHPILVRYLLDLWTRRVVISSVAHLPLPRLQLPTHLRQILWPFPRRQKPRPEASSVTSLLPNRPVSLHSLPHSDGGLAWNAITLIRCSLHLLHPRPVSEALSIILSRKLPIV